MSLVKHVSKSESNRKFNILLKILFEINDKVKSNNGLQPLVELIKDHSNHENKELMAAVTGIKLLKGKTDSNN